MIFYSMVELSIIKRINGLGLEIGDNKFQKIRSNSPLFFFEFLEVHNDGSMAQITFFIVVDWGEGVFGLCVWALKAQGWIRSVILCATTTQCLNHECVECTIQIEAFSLKWKLVLL